MVIATAQIILGLGLGHSGPVKTEMAAVPVAIGPLSIPVTATGGEP